MSGSDSVESEPSEGDEPSWTAPARCNFLRLADFSFCFGCFLFAAFLIGVSTLVNEDDVERGMGLLCVLVGTPRRVDGIVKVSLTRRLLTVVKYTETSMFF